MPAEIHVSLTLWGGDGNPDRLTKSIGLSPTRTWAKGDLIPCTIIRREDHGWSLESGRMISGMLHEVVETVLRQVADRTDIIDKVREENNLCIQLQCAVYAPEDNIPSMYFSSDAIRMLSEMHSDLDIDFYYLPPECGDS